MVQDISGDYMQGSLFSGSAQSGITVVCSSDEHYAPYCGIMLTSLLENNTVSTVYILTDKAFSEDNRIRIYRLEAVYNVPIKVIVVSDDILKSSKIKTRNAMLAKWLKIAVGELLPQSLSKVLYLDCDIIVNGNIESLWKTDISAYSIALVRSSHSECNRMRISARKGYYSTGVALINLDYWREDGVFQKLLSFVPKNPDQLLLGDQDIMNYVLQDSIKVLPIEYNYQIGGLLNEFFRKMPPIMQGKYLSVVPQIIHYSSQVKPWFVDYYGYPFRNEWIKYIKISFWNDVRYIWPETNLWGKVKMFLLRYCMWPLGILSRNEIIQR